jgi:hypothetical protein
MQHFTRDELEKIIFWGMDRCESIGKQEFEAEGSTAVYLKAEYYLTHYDTPDAIRERTLLHGGVSK